MAESRREEQKLWLILFQISAIRTRLNLLAVQYWIFATLAVLLSLAALIFYGSLLLPPLVFLGATALGIIATGWGLWRVIGATRRRWASPSRAAALADKRAALKGRLGAILSLNKTAAASALWSHLLEDTYLRRETFEPRRIEPRWVSRAILALGAVCAVVALIPFIASLPVRFHGRTATVAPASISADIDNLSIEPADPGEAANARVYADAATLKRLEAKLAAAKKTASNDSGLKRWMNRARNFAGDLQDRVARRKPSALAPLDLHLHGGANSRTPNSGNSSPPDSALANNSSNSTRPGGGSSPGGTASADNGKKPPRVDLPADQADQLAGNAPGLPPTPDSGQTEAGQGAPGTYGGPTLDGGNGSMHSGGTDPAHLFGPPTPEQLGSDNFKIAIDAAPSDEASTPGATAYIPPEVRVPLNPEQAPDQPLARAAIPAADQATIKRVFER